MDREATEAPLTGPRVHKATLARVAPTPTAGRIVFPPKELLKFYPAVPVQKQGLCRCDQVKMRSYYLDCGCGYTGVYTFVKTQQMIPLKWVTDPKMNRLNFWKQKKYV